MDAGYELEREYLRCATKPNGDIAEHLPRLRALARGFDHVTELGTRGADGSTVAFLAAQPTWLCCYDIAPCHSIERLVQMQGKTILQFVQADVLKVTLPETDLLFIDTWHVYEQLQAELWMHGDRARFHIAMHDTVTFGQQGENGGRGLWAAVEEFCAAGKWQIAEHYTHNNGLTILSRRR
jgi:hypothetical protein